MEITPMDLTNLGGGAIPELFAHELRRVMDNIADINTDPGKVRTITIQIAIAANDERNEAQTKTTVKSSLAGVRAAGGALFLRREAGSLVPYAVNPNQGELPLVESKITLITKES